MKSSEGKLKKRRGGSEFAYQKTKKVKKSTALSTLAESLQCLSTFIICPKKTVFSFLF
jgi:hypothetical protein